MPSHRKLSLIFIYLFFTYFLFYFIFKLYIIVLVLPNIKMNPPQVYMRSPSEPSSLLPPHSIPLGRPSAPAPKTHEYVFPDRFTFASAVHEILVVLYSHQLLGW